MLPLPKLNAGSLLDYGALAFGLAIGFAVMTAPMKQVEDAIRKSS